MKLSKTEFGCADIRGIYRYRFIAFWKVLEEMRPDGSIVSVRSRKSTVLSKSVSPQRRLWPVLLLKLSMVSCSSCLQLTVLSVVTMKIASSIKRLLKRMRVLLKPASGVLIAVSSWKE